MRVYNEDSFMKKVVISSEKAPKASLYFSQATLTINTYRLELSGQIGIDAQTEQLVSGGIAGQTQQCFTNIGYILSELGWTCDEIVKVRVYLTSMKHYQEVNEIYKTKFKFSPPARVTVAVKELPLGALVEIECTAESDELSEDAQYKYSLRR